MLLPGMLSVWFTSTLIKILHRFGYSYMNMGVERRVRAVAGDQLRGDEAWNSSQKSQGIEGNSHMSVGLSD